MSESEGHLTCSKCGKKTNVICMYTNRKGDYVDTCEMCRYEDEKEASRHFL